MKIYSCPKEVPAPAPNYEDYDCARAEADEAAHMEKLKAFLRKAGYKGKYTGEIYREGVADGYALYMVADGTPFGLVHLPYGDAYQARDVSWLPKKEIIRRLEADKKLKAFWAKNIKKA